MSTRNLWVLLSVCIAWGSAVAQEEGTTETNEDQVQPPAAAATPAQANTEAVSEGASKGESSTESPTMEMESKPLQTSVSPEETPSIKAPFSVFTSGFMRVGYRAILQDDSSPDFVGRNDGFYIDSARVNLNLKRERLSARISFDGAVSNQEASNTAEGQLSVSLIDAYFDYQLMEGIVIRSGRFRPAFDLEMERSRGEIIFVERAIYNRGVRGVEGFNLSGLGLSREVGASLIGQYGNPKALNGTYTLAVTNGNDANELANDNEEAAITSRATVKWTDQLALGAAARFNRRTTGEAPDLIDQDELSLTADVQLKQRFGENYVELEGALSQRSIEVKEVGTQPSVTMRGYHAGVVFGRKEIALAYRYAVFDPTHDFADTSDAQLSEAFGADTLNRHTISLCYRPREGAITWQANFTLAQEDEARAYANDRLDLLAQLVF